MKNKRHLAFHVVAGKTNKTKSDEKLRINMGLNNTESSTQKPIQKMLWERRIKKYENFK